MPSVGEKPTNQAKLVTNLYFLARDPKYATVKPYTVRFDPKGKYPYTNIDNVKHSVTLSNLRPTLNRLSGAFTVEKNGFQILTISERMTYADFENDETFRAVHVPHILTTLQTELKAKHVHVLDYRVSAFRCLHLLTTNLHHIRLENEMRISPSALSSNTNFSSHLHVCTLVNY